MAGPDRHPIMGLVKSTAFEPNALLRGAQLSLVGAYRALQNPGLFSSDHYRQAALAVVAGIAITLLLAIPTFFLQLLLRFFRYFDANEAATWDADILEGINYITQHVLQVPFFLMTCMRYLSPTLDHTFMEGLAWVDKTYMTKHEGENPDALRAMYYPNLKLYENASSLEGKGTEQKAKMAAQRFLYRSGRKSALSLAVYLASFLPVVGKFVLPAASFYTFNDAVGTPAAVAIFATGIFLPRRYLVMFLQSYFSSRTLMRELLDPYFSRIRYPPEKKRLWFHDRSGVLYGFALSFYVLLRIPLAGVLIYGIAEASTAYLITKITEPPPPPGEPEAVKTFINEDVVWKYKKEFLNLPLDKLDRLNISTKLREKLRLGSVDHGVELKKREFT